MRRPCSSTYGYTGVLSSNPYVTQYCWSRWGPRWNIFGIYYTRSCTLVSESQIALMFHNP